MLKKLMLSAALIFAVIFTGCEDSENNYVPVSEYCVIDYNDFFQYENGEIYVDTSQRLHFADFSSVADVIICPKPNCAHNDETCSALGMDNHPVVVDGNIYWFEDNTYYEGEIPTSSLNVYKAALDGNGRVKTDSIDGVTMRSGFDAAFGNGVLYFCGMNEHPEGEPTGVREAYLCGYDFKKKKLFEKEFLCKGYSCGVSFCGELDGEIYFILSFQSEKADWQDGDTEEAREHNGAELRRVSITEYKKFDPKTQIISDWELPEKIVSEHEKRVFDPNVPASPIYAKIKDGATIYSDGKDTLIVNPGGREIFINDFNGNDTAVVNGYIFGELSSGENTARRLSDGKNVTVNITKENVRAGYMAKYLDGKYIIRYIDFERQETLYCALSEEELFGK